MVLPVILGLAALWILIGLAALGLCWAAGRGDRQLLAGGEPGERSAPPVQLFPAA